MRTIWNDTYASGLTPFGLATLLRAAGEGDHHAYLTLAEEMEERDLHYAAELGKRKLAVSRLPISVESASDDPRDLELADAARELIDRGGIRGLLKDMLDALGKGFACCEIVWRRGARWVPERYEWRDPRFFQWDLVSRRETDIAPVIAVSLPESQPSLVWAWRLYADPGRAEERARRAGAASPAAMPTRFEALSN